MRTGIAVRYEREVDTVCDLVHDGSKDEQYNNDCNWNRP